MTSIDRRQPQREVARNETDFLWKLITAAGDRALLVKLTTIGENCPLLLETDHCYKIWLLLLKTDICFWKIIICKERQHMILGTKDEDCDKSADKIMEVVRKKRVILHT